MDSIHPHESSIQRRAGRQSFEILAPVHLFDAEKFLFLLPSPRGSNQSPGDHAQPEIDDQPPVKLEWSMPRQMKSRTKEKIEEIAENDAAEGLNQVHCNRSSWSRRHAGC